MSVTIAVIWYMNATNSLEVRRKLNPGLLKDQHVAGFRLAHDHLQHQDKTNN